MGLYRTDLLKFLQGEHRCKGRLTAWLLANVKFVVDRFHWPNHKEERFCAKFVNPKKCAELTQLGPTTNTEAAEEVSCASFNTSAQLPPN
jgi:hypothetical protein